MDFEPENQLQNPFSISYVLQNELSLFHIHFKYLESIFILLNIRCKIESFI
jgi:hypothetical protein